MTNALQEQLLKAGLADEKALRKQQPGRGREHGRGQGKAKGRRQSGRRADARSQPLEAYIPLPDLIRHYALPRWGGDTPYHFTQGERIRWVWVTRQQQRQLADGDAGIVAIESGFEVVPRVVAEQAQERAPEAVQVLHPRREHC
ncbi:MAG: DUF2058 family protein [Halorhodospira sp.]